MSRPNRGLPRGERAFNRSLDSLTDPGPAAPVEPAAPVPLERFDDGPIDGGTRGTSGTSGNAATSGVSVASGSTATAKAKPAARQHVKVRSDLVDGLRDAVWFLSENGRPRVQLGELVDEAVAAFLADAKKQHNAGEDFPRRGRLR